MADRVQSVADIYGVLAKSEPGRTVPQFRSLPQADQYRQLYALTGKYMRPGARVLDWGCGNGHFSFFLAKSGATVTSYAFEPEPPAVFSLLSPQERSRVSYVRASTDDPQSLPFQDRSFDCVFSIGVLEHVRETGGTEAGSLAEIHRVLRSDGKFICYHLPNQYSWIEAVNRLVHGPLDPTMRIPWKYHKYRFTKREIEALCQGSGFGIEEIHRYGAVPRNILSRLPGSLRHSRLMTGAVNGVDVVLESLLPGISQNYAFVATARA